jgi:hypothetical protein
MQTIVGIAWMGCIRRHPPLATGHHPIGGVADVSGAVAMRQPASGGVWGPSGGQHADAQRAAQGDGSSGRQSSKVLVWCMARQPDAAAPRLGEIQLWPTLRGTLHLLTAHMLIHQVTATCVLALPVCCNTAAWPLWNSNFRDGRKIFTRATRVPSTVILYSCVPDMLPRPSAE